VIGAVKFLTAWGGARSEMNKHQSRFVLSGVIEGEILDSNSYDIFEPTLKLEIQGRDVLKEVGIDGISRVVIMHFMESALKETQRMVNELPSTANGEYTYWFLGTGFGVKLRRHGNISEVELMMDSQKGPTGTSETHKGTKTLGSISVNEWVRMIVSLSKELNERFQKANSRAYQNLSGQEARRNVLESWLVSST
jgi:hypothetical protein